ncbi:Phosphoglucosamine mutase [compost metagenome]
MFKELGAEVHTIAAEPNGLNINDHCGSTHPEKLKEEVIRLGANLGLAFDGDADRLIAIDEKGEEVDGDYILCICGDAMNRAGKLKDSTIVSTVMSNFGFYKATKKLSLNTQQTAVGDRYVMSEMIRGGYNLGGEQSGHVIFLDYNTTGDGILTAIQLVDTLIASGKQLSELKTVMKQYPQVLVNVRVQDKSKYVGNVAIEQAITEVENKLSDNGRVLVRPSGTESLIRVMAEGPEKQELEELVGQIVAVVEKELV